MSSNAQAAVPSQLLYIMRLQCSASHTLYTALQKSTSSPRLLIGLYKFSTQDSHRTTIRMQFIPDHRGVPGNEAADSGTKAAHLLRYRTLTPYSKEKTVSLACKAFRTLWNSTLLQQVRVIGKERHLAQIRDSSGNLFWPSH
ncbi:hypothetical protein FHG87_022097 [Trinorchestia longiramus]|nr:hypothetical protein FHG87_022097 [Trinorchestia longiramus]